MDVDPPVGDAGEMRVKAARLGVECDVLVHLAHDLERLAATMEYECPAADRFRAEIRGQRLFVERICHDLREVQARLLREAARVEAAWVGYARLSLRLEDVESAAEGVLRSLYLEARAESMRSI